MKGSACGVMGIATYTSNEFRVRLDFELLQQYKKELEAYFDSSFDTLSMGMSDDHPRRWTTERRWYASGRSSSAKRDYAAAEKKRRRSDLRPNSGCRY